jgi:hypothetical protein
MIPTLKIISGTQAEILEKTIETTGTIAPHSVVIAVLALGMLFLFLRFMTASGVKSNDQLMLILKQSNEYVGKNTEVLATLVGQVQRLTDKVEAKIERLEAKLNK